VLKKLSFDNRTTASACFGLGMVMLGFTVSALAILHLNSIRYLPLGHVGHKQRAFKEELYDVIPEKEDNSADDTLAAVPDPAPAVTAL
jgi:hypothetical protein